ncbi:MAG: hypothetical protein DMF24_03755 [Verrucomicrobia bacterium]|nr:MAG: hypothetical protein DMF24_03755 [Verrucomicrobiota bacterium]
MAGRHAQGNGVSLNIWSDQQIRPAGRWRKDINEALGTAAAAVLFLSPAFFESSFIREHELPAILAAAQRSELRLFAVVKIRHRCAGSSRRGAGPLLNIFRH